MSLLTSWRSFGDFQPYKGGNNTLWGLNALCNAKKHTILAPTGLLAGRTNIHAVMTGPVQLTAPKWDREKNEIALLRLGANARFNGQADIIFTVAFEDVETFSGQPAIERYFTPLQAKLIAS